MTQPGTNKNRNPIERFLRSLKSPAGQCEMGLGFMLPLFFWVFFFSWKEGGKFYLESVEALGDLMQGELF